MSRLIVALALVGATAPLGRAAVLTRIDGQTPPAVLQSPGDWLYVTIASRPPHEHLDVRAYDAPFRYRPVDDHFWIRRTTALMRVWAGFNIWDQDVSQYLDDPSLTVRVGAGTGDRFNGPWARQFAFNDDPYVWIPSLGRVPEPATLALASAGLALAVARRPRGRARAA